MSSHPVLFPGGTSVSRLRVYPWVASDGEAGGTPHFHTVCTEAYVVLGGRGRVQTISRDGFVETVLTPTSVVWFMPGVIHRVINDGDLQLLVVMQNSGLPEAGDAVMTFLPDRLESLDRYDALAKLPSPAAVGADGVEDAVRARQHAAVEGFTRIREAAVRGDERPLTELYEAALNMVSPKTAGWRDVWLAGAAAAAAETDGYLAAMAEGNIQHLGQHPALTLSEPDSNRFGMCGYLQTYDLIPTAIPSH